MMPLVVNWLLAAVRRRRASPLAQTSNDPPLAGVLLFALEAGEKALELHDLVDGLVFLIWVPPHNVIGLCVLGEMICSGAR